MTSSDKALYFLDKYSESEAILQAAQCLELAPYKEKDYWWNVIEKIKYNG
jgi:hypothetical protein